MIELPDFSKAWDYENGFYLSCDNSRFSKFLAHYELYKRILGLRGSLVECGVFKGASFVRFAALRSLLEGDAARPLVGFDTFGPFPAAHFEPDKPYVQKWIDAAGEESISRAQLREVLERKKITNTELIEGDVAKTIPTYIEAHPDLQIALLNLDTDIYEPSVVILEHLWPRVVRGGGLILD